jgi:hypothetical protein
VTVVPVTVVKPADPPVNVVNDPASPVTVAPDTVLVPIIVCPWIVPVDVIFPEIDWTMPETVTV